LQFIVIGGLTHDHEMVEGGFEILDLSFKMRHFDLAPIVPFTRR
jgi:hypothetical protein